MYKPIWMDGNGRFSCSDLRCAGMTAHFNGMRHDLNGAQMEQVTLSDVREFNALGMTIKCESCGAQAQTVTE